LGFSKSSSLGKASKLFAAIGTFGFKDLLDSKLLKRVSNLRITNPSDARVLEGIWVSWRAFVIHWSSRPDWRKKESREAIQYLCLSALRLLDSYSRVGLTQTVKKLKNFYNRMRGLAIQAEGFSYTRNSRRWSPREELFVLRGKLAWRRRGEMGCSPQYLYHISTLARAIPEPGEDVVREALEKHRSVICSPPSTDFPDSMATDIRNYAKEVASKLTGNLGQVGMSTSAVIGFPSSKGGNSYYLRQRIDSLIREIRSGKKVLDLVDETSTGNTARALFRSVDINREAALGLSNPLIARSLVRQVVREDQYGLVAEARVNAILEKGYKARIVTTLHPTCRLALEPIANRIRPVIQLLPGCRLIWKDDWFVVDDYIQRFQDQKIHLSDWFRSADLTTSTDTIPHKAIFAMVEGFSEALGFEATAPEYMALIKSSGPTKLTYPDGTVDVTLRGTLMGSPMSFIFLCVLHSFICEVSGIRFHRLKGDDLVFPCTRRQSEVYTANMEALGWTFSVGKDYLAKGFVFCELGWLPGTPGRFPWIPMRRFQSTDKDAPFSIREQLRLDRQVAHRAAVAMSAINKSNIRYLRSKGLDPYLPKELGGVGLLPPRGIGRFMKRLSQKKSTCLAWLLTECDRKVAVALLSEVSWAGSRVRDFIDRRSTVEEVATWIEIGMIEVVPCDENDKDRTTLPELVSRAEVMRLKMSWINPRVPIRAPKQYRPSLPHLLKVLLGKRPRSFNRRLKFPDDYLSFAEALNAPVKALSWGMGSQPETFRFRYREQDWL
jgi:hypothetical protein